MITDETTPGEAGLDTVQQAIAEIFNLQRFVFPRHRCLSGRSGLPI